MKQYCLLIIWFIALSFSLSLNIEEVAAQDEALNSSCTPINVENAHNLTQLRQLGQGRIDHISWSPNNDIIAVGSSIGTWLYDAQNPFSKPILLPNLYLPTFSPTSELMAFSDGYGYNVIIENYHDHQVISTLESKVEHSIWSLAFSPDGKSLALGDSAGNVQLWNVESNTKLLQWNAPVEAAIEVLAFSQNGKILTVGESSGMVRILNTTNGSQIAQFEVNRLDISDLKINQINNESEVIAIDEKGSIARWNTKTQAPELFIVDDPEYYSKIILSSDNRLIALATLSGEIRLKGREDGRLLGSVIGSAYSSHIEDLAFSSDDQWLASVGEDRKLYIWNTNDLSWKFSVDLEGASGPINSLTIEDNNQTVLTAGFSDFIKGWNLKTGKQILNYPPDESTFSTTSLITASNGRYIIYGVYGYIRSVFPRSIGASVIVWDTIISTKQVILSGGDRNVVALALDADERILATGGWKEGSIRLWDLVTQKELAPLRTQDIVEQLLFLAPNILVSVVQNGRVLIWDISTQKQISTLKGFAVTYDQKHDVLAVQTGEQVNLFNTANFQQITSFPIVGGLIEYSPNGEVIASYQSGELYLWDAANGKELSRQPTADINVIKFTSDGNLLLTGDLTGILRIWGC